MTAVRAGRMMAAMLAAAMVIALGCNSEKAARSPGPPKQTEGDRERGGGVMPGTGANSGSGSGVGIGNLDVGGGGDGAGNKVQILLDGDLEIEAGAISKDVVRKVVKEHVSKLQYCYEKTLLANPGIEGTVTAKFTIEPDGSVGDVKAAGVHPDVETCVSDTVKAFQFPPSAAKVEVSYPFTFKPA